VEHALLMLEADSDQEEEECYSTVSESEGVPFDCQRHAFRGANRAHQGKALYASS